MRTRRKSRLLPLLLTLALLGLALVVVIRLHKPAEPEDPHAGQVYVYDGFDWVWMTPLEGVEVNPIAKQEFVNEGTTPVYLGDAFTTRVGIDVSEHQWDIDWQQAAQVLDFASIRLGYRGYTEGGLFEDPWYRRNMEGALAAGLDVGVYFFSQATTVAEAIEEAEYVLERVKDYRLEMPIVFDWEKIEDENARTANLDSAVITDCAIAFCETVKKAGYTPCIYFNRNMGYYGFDLSRLTDYLFWFSLPEMGYPSFYYAVDLWQYSFTEEIPGVSVPADMNMMFIPVAAEESD